MLIDLYPMAGYDETNHIVGGMFGDVSTIVAKIWFFMIISTAIFS